MKIAVWIDNNLSPKIGGTFSYVDRLIKEIDKYEFSEGLDICFVTTKFVEIYNLKKEIIRLGTPFESLLSKIPFLRNVVILQRIAYRLYPSFYRKQLERQNVKLIFYPKQFVRRIKDVPFVISHWDIAHRSTYAFPEFSIRLHEDREFYYNNILPKALMIFVESNAGKEELIRYTHLNADRIKVVPIFAGECSSLSVSPGRQSEILYNINLEKCKYFYYPAQFLPEKNHYTVIRAFSCFAKKHPDYKLVFTGSSPQHLFGTIDYIKSEAEFLNISEKVIFAGFVPEEIIFSLYKNASAHIMASYVGPTNMPPLEAMEIGCPVICSDLPGHREEMGDAALYFNAGSVDQLLSAMEEMVENRDLYLKRIEKQSVVGPFKISNAIRSINDNLIEASIIRKTWA